jgi:hypothetical protein
MGHKGRAFMSALGQKLTSHGPGAVSRFSSKSRHWSFVKASLLPGRSFPVLPKTFPDNFHREYCQETS